MSPRREARREAAYIELERHPDGLPLTALAGEVGCTVRQARTAIRDIRRIKAGEPVTVIATPNGRSQPWIYSLCANVEVAKPWVINRLRDMEGRGETNHAACTSLVAATADDPDSVEAREARIWERCYRRALEDLADIHRGQPRLPIS